MDYKEEIEKILEESREDIKVSIKEKIKEKIIDNLSWTLDDEIKKTIEDVVETELSDEIKKVVIESKQEIISGIRPALAQIGSDIAIELEKKAKENLMNSWTSRKIAEQLFN